MADLHSSIAANLTECRKKAGLTQKQVADSIQYSDKTVSKWERGDLLPDIDVLKGLADLYGVSVDYLLESSHETTEEEKKEKRNKKRNYIFIVSMSIMLVFFIAIVVYTILHYLIPASPWNKFIFVYAVPVACVVWLVLNSCWLNKRLNFLIISLLVWSVLATVYVTFIPFGLYLNLLFLIGIPGQLIIIFWANIKKVK